LALVVGAVTIVDSVGDGWCPFLWLGAGLYSHVWVEQIMTEQQARAALAKAKGEQA